MAIAPPVGYLCPRGHRWTAPTGGPSNCPECGQPGAAVPAPPTIDPAPSVSTAACPRCGQALRFLTPARPGAVIHCPHCTEVVHLEGGTAVAVGPPPAAAGATVPPPLPAIPVTLTTAVPPSQSGPPPPPLASPPTAHPTATSNRAPGGQGLVPGYTLVGELGRGAAGVVYKARHERLKRMVALKLVLVDGRSGSLDLGRFHAEAEAVAHLHHPNIVQIYEIGESNGRPFLALEFVSGGTLRERLEAGLPTPRAAAQLTLTLARAVHAAHARGVVHRDLKPANILLAPPAPADDRDDEAPADEALHFFGVPKIVDFGLAKRVDHEGAATRLGEVVGTPAYMSPEQARGRTDETGPATDVYALGVILYEMLSGRTPFKSDSLLDLLHQVATLPPTPPRRLARKVPRDLERICLRCLEKDPRRRYRSALALADDLQRFLNGEPIRAHPSNALMRGWSWSLRHPVPASLLGAALLVLGFGLWQLSNLADVMVRQTALESAAQQAEMLRQTNELYTEVAGEAEKAGVERVSQWPQDGRNTIPIPVAFTIALGHRIEEKDQTAGEGARRHKFTRLRVYSDFPFRSREGDPPRHKFGQEALAFYADRANAAREFSSFELDGDVRVLRYAVPMVMKAECCGCHNDPTRYKKGGKMRDRDWEPGEVRGVLEIIRPLESDYAQTRSLLFRTYAVLGAVGVGLLAGCWLLLHGGRRLRG